MANPKSSSILGLIQGLANFYSEIKVANKESGQYKISNIIAGSLSEEPQVIVQIRNKNISHALGVMDIVSNDNILHQFSRRDIKALVYVACEYKNRPKVKLDKLSFCGKLKKMVFHFARGSRPDISGADTAAGLMASDDVISNMSSHDAVKVGYTAGSEACQDQQDQINKLNVES